LFSKKSFLTTKARIGQKPAIFAVGPLESIDIDTYEDWEMAVHLVDFFKKKRG
jgi:CMP-N-acetylneuraminic acid synthetase